jgi:hypothetical protein
MIRRLILAGAIVFTATVSFAQDKAAPAHAAIGVKKCMMCHKGEAKGNVHEKWLATKHANAFKLLVDKKDGSDKKAECLACHTTAYGNGGYAIGAANAAEYEGVQCESCHGAGADYKLTHSKDLAAAAGQGFVAKPDEKTCKSCHNEKSPTFNKDKPFNFKEYYAKINHTYRTKK